MVKVVQNIPTVLLYLPPQLSVSSQVCFHPERKVFTSSFWTHSRFPLSAGTTAEPVSVGRGGFRRGVVGEEEEAACSGGAGSAGRWLQTGCRIQTLLSTGISEKQYLFTRLYIT